MNPFLKCSRFLYTGYNFINKISTAGHCDLGNKTSSFLFIKKRARQHWSSQFNLVTSRPSKNNTSKKWTRSWQRVWNTLKILNCCQCQLSAAQTRTLTVHIVWKHGGTCVAVFFFLCQIFLTWFWFCGNSGANTTCLLCQQESVCINFAMLSHTWEVNEMKCVKKTHSED